MNGFGKVDFHKYGNTDFLNRTWVEGQRYGKVELKAAAGTKAMEYSLVANKR